MTTATPPPPPPPMPPQHWVDTRTEILTMLSVGGLKLAGGSQYRRRAGESSAAAARARAGSVSLPDNSIFPLRRFVPSLESRYARRVAHIRQREEERVEKEGRHPLLLDVSRLKALTTSACQHLGEGAGSTVWKVPTHKIYPREETPLDNESGEGEEDQHVKHRHRQSVVKVLSGRYINPDQLEPLLTEIQILADMPAHPNVLPIEGACVVHPHYALMMPLAEGGNLFDLLHSPLQFPSSSPSSRLSIINDELLSSLEWRLSVALDVAQGLSHLHQHRIVHRDVKSSNVLVTSDRRAIVCDLGHSVKCTRDQPFTWSEACASIPTPQIGTPLYMAPEVVLRSPCTTAADMYSFGVVLCEVFTGRVPFDECDLDPETVMQRVAVEGLRPNMDHVPSDIGRFVAQCLDADPSMRPSSSSAVETLKTLLRVYSDTELRVERLVPSTSTVVENESTSNIASLFEESPSTSPDAGNISAGRPKAKILKRFKTDCYLNVYQMLSLQKSDGSWDLTDDIGTVIGVPVATLRQKVQRAMLALLPEDVLTRIPGFDEEGEGCTYVATVSALGFLLEVIEQTTSASVITNVTRRVGDSEVVTRERVFGDGDATSGNTYLARFPKIERMGCANFEDECRHWLTSSCEGMGVEALESLLDEVRKLICTIVPDNYELRMGHLKKEIAELCAKQGYVT